MEVSCINYEQKDKIICWNLSLFHLMILSFVDKDEMQEAEQF